MATTRGYMMRNDALQMLLRCSFLLIPTMLLFAGETAGHQTRKGATITSVAQPKQIAADREAIFAVGKSLGGQDRVVSSRYLSLKP